jgi:hypothetical protein
MQRHVIAAAIIAAAMFATPSAWAQEPVGCDKFKWDVTRERAALAQTDLPKLASGSELTGTLPQAFVLDLKAPADANLPSPPERAPKPDTFAGFTTVKTVPANGLYSVTLSAGAWIDVLQNGAFLKPKAFSGVTGCDGIRKTVKFDLVAGPAIIQVSSVPASTIKIAVMPVTE